MSSQMLTQERPELAVRYRRGVFVVADLLGCIMRRHTHDLKDYIQQQKALL